MITVLCIGSLMGRFCTIFTGNRSRCLRRERCWADCTLLECPWSVAVARLLIKKNVDVNLQGRIGVTAPHRAASRGSEAMVHWLLENGANASLKDADNWKPLHGTCVKQHTDVGAVAVR